MTSKIVKASLKQVDEEKQLKMTVCKNNPFVKTVCKKIDQRNNQFVKKMTLNIKIEKYFYFSQMRG